MVVSKRIGSEKMKEKKKCWELFSIPQITDTGYPNDNDTAKLIFHCERTNTDINVYYPKKENIDVETMSKIMSSMLSLCLHCTGKKPLHDSGYIVH